MKYAESSLRSSISTAGPGVLILGVFCTHIDNATFPVFSPLHYYTTTDSVENTCQKYSTSRVSTFSQAEYVMEQWEDSRRQGRPLGVEKLKVCQPQPHPPTEMSIPENEATRRRLLFKCKIMSSLPAEHLRGMQLTVHVIRRNNTALRAW